MDRKATPSPELQPIPYSRGRTTHQLLDTEPHIKIPNQSSQNRQLKAGKNRPGNFHLQGAACSRTKDPLRYNRDSPSTWICNALSTPRKPKQQIHCTPAYGSNNTVAATTSNERPHSGPTPFYIKIIPSHASAELQTETRPNHKAIAELPIGIEQQSLSGSLHNIGHQHSPQ
ncbi:hypothetical protein Nepgr_033789 [Nepenthes gracilis]|uniref:Uncharacterized protein n=1 Tax=Nepenthes gracilis TaxID=150966 RepID=A0AAD3TLT1_NEPGR|nr:hypothetical protein Nepgr_033789 [Nepenthes gracilis]